MDKVCIMFGNPSFFGITDGLWMEGEKKVTADSAVSDEHKETLAFILLPDSAVSDEHKETLRKRKTATATYWLHSDDTCGDNQAAAIKAIWPSAEKRGIFSHIGTTEPAKSVLSLKDPNNLQEKILAIVEGAFHAVILEALERLAAYEQLRIIMRVYDGDRGLAYDRLSSHLEGDDKTTLDKANLKGGMLMLAALARIATGHIK